MKIKTSFCNPSLPAFGTLNRKLCTYIHYFGKCLLHYYLFALLKHIELVLC